MDVVTGLRDLKPEEWELIAGGTITVNGSPPDDWYPPEVDNDGDPDGGWGYGGGGGGGGQSESEYWEEREANFKIAVKTLIAGNAVVKEFVATVITEIRTFLINAISLENKEAASDWFDNNTQALANWFVDDYMGGLPNGNSPLESYQAIFGGPDPDWDWED